MGERMRPRTRRGTPVAKDRGRTGKGTAAARVRVRRDPARDRAMARTSARAGTRGVRALTGVPLSAPARRRGLTPAGRRSQGASRSRTSFKTGGAWQKTRRTQLRDGGAARSTALSGRTTRAR
jgi:hypothetical protein